MDISKVDLLIKFVLTTAGHEDPDRRELGPIHVIKYLYLADLAYAEKNGGESFTGVQWQFYHYGPWSAEVYGRISGTAHAAGAAERIFASRFRDDNIRWRLEDEELFEELGSTLPEGVVRVLKQAVHEFGNDTPTLLHYIYRTPPMLHAAPGEILEFRCAVPLHESHLEEATSTPVIPVVTLSVRAKKRRKAAVEAARARMQEVLKASRSKRMVTPPPPRYDEVFFEGMQWLDSLAGEILEPCEGQLNFSVDIWKSTSRGNSGVS